MPATLDDLYKFIDTAKKDRKYMPNTAHGRKAALTVFASELNEDEKASVDLFMERLDRISDVVFQKNQNNNKFTTSTLSLYKSRVSNLINDFNKYGNSVEAMSKWQPGKKPLKKSQSKPITSQKENELNNSANDFDYSAPIKAHMESRGEHYSSTITNYHQLSVMLRPGLRVEFRLPFDLTSKEAEKLKMHITASINDD